MATIVKRPRKGGSFSYLARIRIARRGQPDFTESRTFPKKAMAEEWAKRRELELMQPGGILTAKWCGVTMSTLRKWDVVDHISTEEDMALYLEACLEEDDPALVVAALGDIARARGMSQLARDPD